MDGCKHKRLKTLCNIDKDIWKKNIHVNFIRPYFKKFIEEIKRQKFRHSNFSNWRRINKIRKN